MLSSHQSHSFSLFLSISLSIYLSFSSFSSISSHIHIVLFIYSSFFDQTIFRNQPSIEMDKVFHSFIIIIIIVRFLFRRNIYIYIYRFFPPFFFNFFNQRRRETSLSISIPPSPSLRDISRGNGFYPGLSIFFFFAGFATFRWEFGAERSCSNSTLIHQTYPPTSPPTSPLFIHHTIYIPATRYIAPRY